MVLWLNILDLLNWHYNFPIMLLFFQKVSYGKNLIYPWKYYFILLYILDYLSYRLHVKRNYLSHQFLLNLTIQHLQRIACWGCSYFSVWESLSTICTSYWSQVLHWNLDLIFQSFFIAQTTKFTNFWCS